MIVNTQLPCSTLWPAGLSTVCQVLFSSKLLTSATAAACHSAACSVDCAALEEAGTLILPSLACTEAVNAWIVSCGRLAI